MRPPSWKSLPGASDDDPAADYGGNSYTLTDVVFSIQPANQGPQAFGDYSAAFDPKIASKLDFSSLTKADFGIQYPALNSFKLDSMKGDFFSTATKVLG